MVHTFQRLPLARLAAAVARCRASIFAGRSIYSYTHRREMEALTVARAMCVPIWNLSASSDSNLAVPVSACAKSGAGQRDANLDRACRRRDDDQTTNLGVGGSNPPRRANEINGLAFLPFHSDRFRQRLR